MGDSKLEKKKRKNKNKRLKYIRRRIGVISFLILALAFIGVQISLSGKTKVTKGNTENSTSDESEEIKNLYKEEETINKNDNNESENKEEYVTVEPPKFEYTDIVPGSNVTFEGKAYAINGEDVNKMVLGTYDGEEKYVFLTFDDGPSPLTEEVLDILEKEEVKSTFFMIGSMLDSGQAAKNTLKRTIKEGHAIGNHSYSHDFKRLYPGNIIDIEYFMEEFNRTNNIMKDILGIEFDTKVLRLPGGYNSRVYYKDSNLNQLNSVLEVNKIVNVDWNSLNGDAEGKPYTRKEMIEYVKNTSNGKNQIILLMHDTYGKEKTIDILPDIIKYYKENGYEFKTISNSDVD